MAISIPNIDDLKDQILNNYATELEISVDELGDQFIVDAKVQAALLYQFYLTAGRVELNIFPDLCDEDTLSRFGNGLLGRSISPAEAGVYDVEVIGMIGASIASGTTFKSDDTSNAPGYLFVVDLDFTLTSETDTLSLRALTSGLDSKLNVDNTLTSTQPLLNVTDQVKVSEVTTSPSDAESTSSYRDDTLDALRLEPQGGSPSDFVLWALDVPEVRTVYVYLKPNNIGSIEVYTEATAENSEAIIGVPSQTILDEVYKKPSSGVAESGALVYNEAEKRGRRPVGIFSIESLPVEPLPVDLEFTDLTNTSASTAIATAVEAYLYDIRPYVAGAVSLLDKNDILTVGQLIALVVSTLEDEGGTFSDLNITVDSVDASSYTFTYGYYPYLRTIYNNGLPI